MNRIEHILRRTESVMRIFEWIAAIAVCLIFILMLGDVLGRLLLNMPIEGAAEYSEMLMVAVAYLALGYAQLKGNHIRMDTIIIHFPKKVLVVVNCFILILTMIFFTIMTIQIGQRSWLDYQGQVLLSATTVHIPLWRQSFMASLGCALLVVSMLIQFIRNIMSLTKHEPIGGA